MTDQHDNGNLPDVPRPADLSAEQKRRVVLASVFRPLNIMTLVAGLGVYAITTRWWMLPITLAVYLTVVYLASRDQVFIANVLEGRKSRASSRSQTRDVPPERRARWLQRGETREQVEAALVTYRKVLVAIDESDDVTRRLLEGSSRRLDEIVEHLVDVAHSRERAERTLQDFPVNSRDAVVDGSNADYLRTHIRKADEEISSISQRLLSLRAQVVRASLDSTGAAQKAEDLNSSLDEINFRLEALNETLADPDGR